MFHGKITAMPQVIPQPENPPEKLDTPCRSVTGVPVEPEVCIRQRLPWPQESPRSAGAAQPPAQHAGSAAQLSPLLPGKIRRRSQPVILKPFPVKRTRWQRHAQDLRKLQFLAGQSNSSPQATDSIQAET